MMNSSTHSTNANPVSALLNADCDGVLAVIIDIKGPSYRPLGAMMAILADGQRVGTLSSGCIESDIALRAKAALNAGRPAKVMYGAGSDYADLVLPCGGNLEILLVPRPDRQVLEQLDRNQINRKPCTLTIEPQTGVLEVIETGETGRTHSHFMVKSEPEIFFYVFGKGPEASTFSALVQSAGYPNLMLSPCEEVLERSAATGSQIRHLKKPIFPPDLTPDQWSAIVLFFHDHEWEPPILNSALLTNAFYIGAQGSRRARDTRHAQILKLGASPANISRLKGPIGLIPSARDARTLSVSVLAEVLQVAQRP